MKYRSLIGHGDGYVSFCMECSGCGHNLRNFTDEIYHHRMKHCPNCGRKLTQRNPKIGNDVIVEMLNATTEVRE